MKIFETGYIKYAFYNTIFSRKKKDFQSTAGMSTNEIGKSLKCET